MTELEHLTQTFSKLGVKNPEIWARSQVEDGIPQLARLVFLRQAWKLVLGEANTEWIDRLRSGAARQPREPGAAIGPALDRLVALGASPDDLTTVVRVMQWELLFAFCQLLEDPGDLEPEVKNICWTLFQVSDDGALIAPIPGLHESVLETDPTGREMRPR